MVWEHLGHQADHCEDHREPHNHVADGVQHLDPVGSTVEQQKDRQKFVKRPKLRQLTLPVYTLSQHTPVNSRRCSLSWLRKEFIDHPGSDVGKCRENSHENTML
jgi:hypothetical protein